MKIVIFFAFYFSIAQAAILKHEVLTPKFQEFSLRDACTALGAKNVELVEAKSLTEIECMGKVYQAMDFCLNKFPMDKTLTRAIVDEKKKMVSCEMSESVMVSVSCDKRDLKYCFDPKKGCEELRKIYANRLETAHYSMLEKNINCYFAKSIGESLNETR